MKVVLLAAPLLLPKLLLLLKERSPYSRRRREESVDGLDCGDCEECSVVLGWGRKVSVS